MQNFDQYQNMFQKFKISECQLSLADSESVHVRIISDDKGFLQLSHRLWTGSGGSSVSVVTRLMAERPGTYSNMIIGNWQRQSFSEVLRTALGPTQFPISPFSDG